MLIGFLLPSALISFVIAFFAGLIIFDQQMAETSRRIAKIVSLCAGLVFLSSIIWAACALRQPLEEELTESLPVVTVGKIQYVQLSDGRMINVNGELGQQFKDGDVIQRTTYKRGPYLGLWYNYTEVKYEIKGKQ